MASIANNTTNVSVGGGVRGGYLFSAPRTAVCPSDYDTPLSEDFVNLGYVTSDGAVMSDTTESTAFTDLNGDTIANANSSESHTFAFTLAEVRKDALAEQYGHRNVSDADGMITIAGKSNGFDERIYCAELVLRDGRRCRFVMPNGQHQSTGDLTVNSTTLYSRQVTVLGMPDEDGVSFYYFIESTETVPESKPEAPKDGEIAGVSVADMGDFTISGSKIEGTAKRLEDFSGFSDQPDRKTGFVMPVSVTPWKGASVQGSLDENPTLFTSAAPVPVYLGKNKIEATYIDIFSADKRKTRLEVDVNAEPPKVGLVSSGNWLGKDVSTFGSYSFDGTKFTGTANKITGFSQFSGIPGEDEGYYIAFSVTPWEGAKIVSSRRPGVQVAIKDADPIILYLGKEDVTVNKIDVIAPDGTSTSYPVEITKGE